MTRTLSRLAARLGGAVALVTGRSISDVDSLLPDAPLAVAGQHGCERRDTGGTYHIYAPSPATHARLRALLAGLANRHEGLLLEDKGVTIALHYRRSPLAATDINRTLRAWLAGDGAARDYVMQPGKMLVEVRPEGRDKGTAIRDFMREAPFAGRRPVYVGDDCTDEHAFLVVCKLGGWSIKVGAGSTAAHFRLPDVASVRRWLAGDTPCTDDPASKKPPCEPSISR